MYMIEGYLIHLSQVAVEQAGAAPRIFRLSVVAVKSARSEKNTVSSYGSTRSQRCAAR